MREFYLTLTSAENSWGQLQRACERVPEQQRQSTDVISFSQAFHERTNSETEATKSMARLKSFFVCRNPQIRLQEEQILNTTMQPSSGDRIHPSTWHSEHRPSASTSAVVSFKFWFRSVNTQANKCNMARHAAPICQELWNEYKAERTTGDLIWTSSFRPHCLPRICPVPHGSAVRWWRAIPVLISWAMLTKCSVMLTHAGATWQTIHNGNCPIVFKRIFIFGISTACGLYHQERYLRDGSTMSTLVIIFNIDWCFSSVSLLGTSGTAGTPPPNVHEWPPNDTNH